MKTDGITRAFVAGATGYVGRNVVGELARRGAAAVAHVRPDSPRLAEFEALFASLGAGIDITPWDDTALAATFRKLRPAVIFSLLGTTRARIQQAADPRRADYEAVDYGLTAMLIRAAKTLETKPRFVYLSAVGVGPTARGAYYEARWKAESELRASGLPHIVARPSFITGPDREEDRAFEKIAAGSLNVAAGLAGAFGFGKVRDRYLSLTGPEIARGLVALALDPATPGGVYETGALRERAR
jgi:nucleoside-diphosphate-sugar epimerase